MATKNKKDITLNLQANIYTNTTRDITALKVQSPFSDLINSMSVNITVAQLQADDNSATQSLVNILDLGLQGTFYYDPNDVVTVDDGGAWCIVNSSGQRFKRKVDRAINAGWYGQANYYFPDLPTALAAIKNATRFVGLEVTILNNGNLTTFWFNGGIADINLVVKVSETFVWDFSPGDGGATTPADGTTAATNVALTGRTILAFFIQGNKTNFRVYPAVIVTADQYGQWVPAGPTMNLENGTYNAGTDYSIMYK